MKKFLALWIVFYIQYLFGETIQQPSNQLELIKTLTQPEISQIGSILGEKDSVSITFSHLDLKVGESGIITRDLGVYEVIVGNAEITKIEGTLATAKVTPPNQLVQPYLPTPNLKPQEGDKIVFRNFNDKAFLIAPNEETYRAVVEYYSFINFVNSDLLMGFLNSRGKHDPTTKTLPQACNEYGVGLVFIVGSESIGVLNCQNVAIIQKYHLTPINKSSIQAPFYTRAKFDGGGSLTYAFATKKSREYYKYYDTFLGDYKESNKK
ncbi:plasminogen-binding protein pgbA [Helicobacter didelphidarum]|uniref:Plasminogen-binding protein pgbA n=1 Tax=Helicobacter didelphidarum TaxID=2040648 RepID=A0A3D8IIM0_9HELI|nr:plasminogen-binding N-terminal domain-containing protein [Helicobacter didelphidarum]RDU64910.1 plasminogen-binding protein pgbA [Helicobacter didelphidarum]